jgi:hypothetical protein
MAPRSKRQSLRAMMFLKGEQMLWKLLIGRCLCDRTQRTEGRPYMNELGGGMSKLMEFVSKQRARFTEKANNVFAFSWAKVFRRWQFMEIVYPQGQNSQH